ncbi:hypothetical protein CL629_01560 [bacterium]|nr:hypothetical protein [bacterium]|tara:strand:+ start:1439 stop:2983 length:1545 start_codon:yes stop_codon:yes gene_type:complete
MKKFLIFFLIILIGIVVGVFLLTSRDEESAYDTVEAERTELIQEVNVTGSVRPADEVQLAFEKAGKVTSVLARVGSQVRTGDSLVRLDSDELEAQLAGAEATLQKRNAELDELLRGTREEEVKIKESELDTAKQTLQNYYDNALTVLDDVYLKADDAVLTKTAGVFQGTGGASIYSLTFTTCNSELELDVVAGRVQSADKLNSWLGELNEFDSGFIQSELDDAFQSSKAYLTFFRGFLDDVSAALTDNCVADDSSLDTYRTAVSTARTNILTALTSIDSQEQDIASQKIAVQSALDELDLKLAGSRPEQISAQRALVLQAEADIDVIEAQIIKTVLISPIDGVVTLRDVEVGEIVSANTSVVSIISDGAFEIEANIPEVDIANVRAGNLAEVTLDPYGDDVKFRAKVLSIDPAETVIDGVVTYKTTLLFEEDDSRIRSGMTANVDILTAERFGVITIPQRTVIFKNGSKIVRLLEGEKVVETEVRTGLSGTHGEIEILDGIQEGDIIVTSIREK